jgi:hypothetical protein
MAMIVLLMVISPLFFLGYQISGGFKRSNQCRQRIIMRLFNTFKRCDILQRGPKKDFCALAIVKTAWIEARANLPLGT